MNKYIVVMLAALCFQCVTNQKPKNRVEANSQTLNLVVDKKDWAVQNALMSDSIYAEIEAYIMDVKNMNLSQAEAEIQSMIDNKLVDKPTLDYYDTQGQRQMMILKYVEFKKYVAILKDSIDGKKRNIR